MSSAINSLKFIKSNKSSCCQNTIPANNREKIVARPARHTYPRHSLASRPCRGAHALPDVTTLMLVYVMKVSRSWLPMRSASKHTNSCVCCVVLYSCAVVCVVMYCVVLLCCALLYCCVVVCVMMYCCVVVCVVLCCIVLCCIAVLYCCVAVCVVLCRVV